MERTKILHEIIDNIDAVAAKDTPWGISLWQAFVELHEADIADLLSLMGKEDAKKLFVTLPETKRIDVFSELSEGMKAAMLGSLDKHDQIKLFDGLPIDELTDLFDYFSDEELKHYLNLLHAKDREQVLSLMRFDPESAGGIMTTDVITLMSDYTVGKSVSILQRLRPRKEVHQQLYVVSRSNQLIGYVNLQDLVLQKPYDRLASFLHKNELVVRADEDREKVAGRMVHYGVMTVPVVDDNNIFLGIIPSDTLVDVLVEEASEDVQRMAALAPLKYPYFETSFIRLFAERASILVILLLAGSISMSVLQAYEAALTGLLLAIVPMLTSTGGNTSNQTSAMVIQGLATGDIDTSNVLRFLRREFLMALLLGIVLGSTALVRVLLTGGLWWESLAAGTAISAIVVTSVVLGSGVPLLLKRMNIDPAFSAGPFLATVMDIIGVVIYCTIVKLMLAR
jgi:magnesium transporter